jgi:hypothetical protein
MSDPNVAPAVPAEPQLPTELQGKSPAEIYQILSNEHNRVLTERELEIRRESVRGAPQEPPKPAASAAQFGPQPPVSGGGEEPNILTDPDGFMERQFAKRINPLYQSVLASQKHTNKQLFVNQVGADEYQRYGPEIEQFVEGLTPPAQMDPRCYQAAYTYVRGLHVDEIVERGSETKIKKKLDELRELGVDTSKLDQPVAPVAQPNLFGNRTVSPASVPTSRPAKQKVSLNQEEQRMARAFNMTDEEYASQRELNSTPY